MHYDPSCARYHSGSLVAEANIVYGAGSSEITGLGNEAVVTTESSLADVTALNTLDGNTTGTVNTATITSVTGTLAKLLTAYGSNGITGLGNEAITVSDTITLAASDLNSIDSKTSGTVTTSTSLATLTGTVAELNTAYGSSGLSIEGDEAITISDTTVDAEALNVLNNYTSGVINADTLTKLTGTLVDVNVAFAADALASGATISGLGDQDVELTDTNILAADLDTLNGYTTGNVDATTVEVMEGTAVTLNSVYAGSASSGNGISGLGNEAVTVTDTTASTSALVTLDGNTAGTIDASAVNTLSGSVDDANSVYASNGFTGLGAEAVTLSDTSLADVAALNTLLVMCFLAGLVLSVEYLAVFVALVGIKSLPDYLLVQKFARISEQRKLLRLFSISALLYPFYIVISGGIILFGTRLQKWKGRPLRI